MEYGSFIRWRDKMNKVEKKVNKILNSDIHVERKISQLQILALRIMASSPNQLFVISTYKKLQGDAK